jgi:protein-disulfide isomerase
MNDLSKRLIPFLFVNFFLSMSFQVKADVTPETKAYIQQQVQTQIQKYMQGPAFNSRVEDGINAYIQKQRNQAEARQQQEDKQGNNAAKVNLQKDHIRGDPNAKYSLIEYSDFECPYCKHFHNTAKKFINTNTDVNWVLRNFPLSFHGKNAKEEAEAAECAAELGGNEVYWKFADGLFERTLTNGRGLPGGGIAQLAKDVGLDKTKFMACVKSGKFQSRIAAEIADGTQAGVNGTPGNFLRYNPTGETLPIHGALPLNQLQSALSELRRRVKMHSK